MKQSTVLQLTVSLLLLLTYHVVFAADLLTSPKNNNAEFLEKWFDDSAKKNQQPVFSEREKATPPATPVTSELLTADMAANNDYYQGRLVWKNLPTKPLLQSIYPGINTDKIFVDPENNLWEKHADESFAPSRGKTFQEASAICQQLSFYGLTDFRLPSKEELALINEDFPFSTSAKFFTRNYWSSTLDQKQVVTLEKHKNRGFENMNPTRHEDFRCTTPFFRDNPLESIAAMIVHRALSRKEKLTLPEKPEPPAAVQFEPLKKDEFESTAEFNARQEKAQKNTRSKSAQTLKEHQSALEKWQQTINRMETNHQKKLADLKANLKKIKQRSLQEALSIKLGFPLFQSVQYDADEETFAITIAANRKNFEETLTQPVERGIARTFKEAILSDFFKIAVVFNYSGDSLDFVGIEQFDNPRLIVDKYLFHLAYNSIEKLKIFLAEDHLPEVMVLAQQRLTELESKQ